MAEHMEVENVEMMEDGEVPADEEITFKREQKISESFQAVFSSLDEEKLKKRAERFGFTPESSEISPVTKEQLKELYESFEISAEDINSLLEPHNSTSESHISKFRLEAIHLRGTEEMSTHDVFDYFKGYAPASIEWINDYSCNVVWLEAWQAARAMLGRSNEIIKLFSPNSSINENADTADQEMIAEDNTVLPIPSPPGIWRKGLETPKAKALLLRFATKTDRKIKGAEKMSHYYRIHGNPNYGGLKGLISSSRKRRFRKKPDLEEQAIDSKNPWGALAEAWGAREDEASWKDKLEEKFPNRSNLPSALVRRLGHQPPRPSPSRSRDTASDNSDPDSDSSNFDSASESSNQGGRSRKKRMRMRMYADEEEEKSRRRAQRANLNKRSPSKETRGSLEKSQQSRPVHSRLGPVASYKSTDLRKRLGPSTNSDALHDHENSDSSEESIGEKPVKDLRARLQGRLGVK